MNIKKKLIIFLFKPLRWLLKVAGIAYVILFVVYFFDLDGKLLYHFVEPNLAAHYDKMKRTDLTGTPYEMKEAL